MERTSCRVACWLKDVCAVLTGERRTVSGRYVQCRCACLPVSFSCRGCVSLPLNTNSLVVASAACLAALFKHLPKVGGVVGLFCFVFFYYDFLLSLHARVTFLMKHTCECIMYSFFNSTTQVEGPQRTSAKRRSAFSLASSLTCRLVFRFSTQEL